eukprot:10805653-Ditylum_brightwellii.AAC.1
MLAFLQSRTVTRSAFLSIARDRARRHIPPTDSSLSTLYSLHCMVCAKVLIFGALESASSHKELLMLM